MKVRDMQAGSELDAAVARALGWKPPISIVPLERFTKVNILDKIKEKEPHPQREFRGWEKLLWETPSGELTHLLPWSRKIELAMTLDGEGWMWKSEEVSAFAGCTDHDTLYMAVYKGGDEEEAFEIYEDVDLPLGNDKVATYALARCILFLLAHGIEEV